MSAGQAKTVKKVCKGNNENCIAIAERIFDKLQTKKIGNGLVLVELQCDMQEIEPQIFNLRFDLLRFTL